MEDPGVQGNSVVDVLVHAVAQVLNTQTPAHEWDDQTKELVGVAIRQTISESLIDVIEHLKNLEPIIVGIFQGPLSEELSRVATMKNTTVGKLVARAAFDAMSEGTDLVCRFRQAE